MRGKIEKLPTSERSRSKWCFYSNRSRCSNNILNDNFEISNGRSSPKQQASDNWQPRNWQPRMAKLYSRLSIFSTVKFLEKHDRGKTIQLILYMTNRQIISNNALTRLFGTIQTLYSLYRLYNRTFKIERDF